jgi:hypothetical protein
MRRFVHEHRLAMADVRVRVGGLIATATRVDRVLMRSERTALVKYAGRRPAGMAVPPDLDVPLIAIFSFEQYQRARPARVSLTLR